MMDRVANKYGNGTLKFDDSSSFPAARRAEVEHEEENIQEINESLWDTLAACGDVNRNVMCNPNPYQSDIHTEVYEWAQKLSDYFSPRTSAYHEIWLDGEKVVDSETTDEETEPMYGHVVFTA